MTVPSSKLLDAPLLKLRETGPEVVGVHSIVAGLPAVTEKPELILNGLSDPCAATAVARMARRESGAKCMLAKTEDLLINDCSEKNVGPGAIEAIGLRIQHVRSEQCLYSECEVNDEDEATSKQREEEVVDKSPFPRAKLERIGKGPGGSPSRCRSTGRACRRVQFHEGAIPERYKGLLTGKPEGKG